MTRNMVESSSGVSRPFGSKKIPAQPATCGPCGFQRRLGYMKSFRPCFVRNFLEIGGNVSCGLPPQVLEKNRRGTAVHLTMSSIGTSKLRWSAGPSISRRSLTVSSLNSGRALGPFFALFLTCEIYVQVIRQARRPI